MTLISVLIADDHPMMRRALALAPGFSVAGEAASGAEAIDLAQRLRPGVIVMDLYLPDMSGIAATRQILLENRGARVLVLTGSVEDGHILEAVRAGARGFLRKDADESDILHALREVALGAFYFPPGVANALAEVVHREARPDPALTPREHDIMRLLATGQSDQEIAEALVMSEVTVRVHLSRIRQKLGLGSRASLIPRARAWYHRDAGSPTG